MSLFLKKDTLPLGSESVVLHELSALQRVEYFEYLASLEAELSENTTDALSTARIMKTNVQVNAWLVSRSLWHSTPKRNEDDIQQEVMRTWSSEALNAAVDMVQRLSNMKPEEAASDGDVKSTDDASEGAAPLEK